VIDLHSHVLPGLDDGAEDLDEAVAMCRAAAEDGIEVLAATPHVRDDYPTTPDQMERALAAVRAAAGDSVRLVGGGEIDIAQLERPREELARFALAGNAKYLLVETPLRRLAARPAGEALPPAGRRNHAGACSPGAERGGTAAAGSAWSRSSPAARSCSSPPRRLTGALDRVRDRVLRRCSTGTSRTCWRATRMRRVCARLEWAPPSRRSATRRWRAG